MNILFTDVCGTQSKESPSVSSKLKPVSMGNQVVRATGEEQTNTGPEEATAVEENEQKTQSEFFDCLNSTVEESPAKKEVQSNKTTNKKSDRLNHKSSPENSKPLHTNNNKKLPKNKNNKKDKNEPPIENGLPMIRTGKLNDDSLSKSVCLESNMIDFQDNTYQEIGLQIKKEESFTEVKKKKKRAVPKEDQFLNNDNASNNYRQTNYPAYHARGNTFRSNQRPRANTPPSVIENKAEQQYVTLTQHTSTITRDLSPSAFPVLAGHNPGGRRTSCGDISADNSDNRVLYDSDRESVKSLPAAPGTKLNSDGSVYPISYARIAAAPKVGYDISPSSESGVVTGSSHNSSEGSSIITTPGSSTEITSPVLPTNPVVGTPERKTTVWKGSPRERRHSIGSSPEDLVEVEKSTLSQRNRQKSGSQEILTRDGSAGQEPGKDSTSPVKNILIEGTDHSIKEKPVKASKNKPVISDTSISSVIIKSSDESPAPDDLPNGPSSPAANLTSADDNLTVKNSVEPAQKTSSVEETSDTSTVKKTTSVNNSSKSVVFLDKRFDSFPKQNLGITFGFDDDYEPCTSISSNSTSQPTVNPNSKDKIEGGDSKGLNHTGSSISFNSSAKQGSSATHSHIPSSEASSCDKQPLSENSQTTTKSDCHCDVNKVPKGLQVHGPSNGIVLPSPSAVKDSSSQKAFVVSSSRNSNSKSTNHNSINGVSKGPGSHTPQTGKNCATVSAPGNMPLPAVPQSGPHSVVIQSTPNVINSGGVIFSPNHPPPPLPGQRCDPIYNTNPVTKVKNVTTDTSKQSNKQTATDTASSPGSTSKSSSNSKFVKDTKEDCSLSTVTLPNSELLKTALPVVYGLKIRPNGGCGMLMFKPPVSREAVKEKNSHEVSRLLRKRK